MTVDGNSIAGTLEQQTFALQYLRGGTSLTIAGVTVTALGSWAGSVPLADVAAAFMGTYTGTKLSVSGTLEGWSVASPAAGQLTFTSTLPGNISTLVPIVTNTVAPTAPTVQIVNGTTSTKEVATVTFGDLKAGQDITVGGRVYYAADNISGADVAAWFKGIGETGYTLTMGSNANTVVYTATATGNISDLTAKSGGTNQEDLAAPVEVDGGAGLVLTALANGSTVELTDANTGSLQVALADTAGDADAVSIMLNGVSNLVNSGVVQVGGIETVNLVTSDTDASIDPAAASTIKLVGAATTDITVTGNHGVDFTGSVLANAVNLDASNVTATGAAGAVTFVSQATDKAMIVTTSGGDDVIDLRSATSTSVGASVNTADGNDTVFDTAGNDTIVTGGGSDRVTISGGKDSVDLGAGDDILVIGAALAVGGTLEGGEDTDTLSMSAAVATALSAAPAATISGFEQLSIGAVSGVGATATVNVANLGNVNYVSSAGNLTEVVNETNTFTFNNLAVNASITIAGRTVTAIGSTGSSVAAADVAAAFEGTYTGRFLTVSGAVTNWKAVSNTPGQVSFTSTIPGNVTNLAPTLSGTTLAAPVVTAAAAGSSLWVTNLANNGTFELAGAIGGTTTVSVPGAASGASDVLNIKLNGNSNIVNTGTLNVANVETIKIVTTDSNAGADPLAASKINLVDTAATTVTVSGNHGVDFTGSNLANLTSLDATGVTASGAAGAVTFTTQVTDKSVAILTGNGDDAIDLRSITSTSVGATVQSGAGHDKVWGSAGKDVIKTGSGNDTVFASIGADSVDLGAGDDTYVIGSSAVAGGTIAGGEGSDVLSMNAATAAALTTTGSTFAASIDGFEKLSIDRITDTTSSTVDLSKMDNINYVVSGGSNVSFNEKSTFTFSPLQYGASITIGGRTVTNIGGTVTAGDVAYAFADAYAGSALRITGTVGNWTGVSDTWGKTTFTSNTLGNVANLTSSVSNVSAPTAPFLSIAANDYNVYEKIDLVFYGLTAGQTVSVYNVWASQNITYTATSTMSSIDVANAFAAMGASGYTITYLSSNSLRYTATTTGIKPGFNTYAYGTDQTLAAPVVIDGSDTTSLAVTNMTSNGTFELTGALASSMTVAVTGAATGTDDVLNIKLNAESNIVNVRSLVVADVETINITTTNSGSTAPTAASKINLVDAAAKTITVSGNHSVDFTGSTMGNVTTLDASGVTASGAAGAVVFTSQATNKFMTVSTGNGNDVIDLRSVTSVDAGSTVDTGAGNDIVWGTGGDDVIKLGAGRDIVYGSYGVDTITLGEGNDLYVLQTASDSTVFVTDTITDFMANTVASGATAAAKAAGATTVVADLDGDTIALKVGSLATAGISVKVVDSSAKAQAFVNAVAAANAVDHTTGIALDKAGNLYIDYDANGSIDSVVTLVGVDTITEAAFVVTH